MPLPVLVVDDSTLARKLLIRSLPEGWDIEITQASDGAAALDLYRAGKAAVMFLDLTMPVMNGFHVLEAIQHEGLDTFVIVVSADVQSGAVERAKALGAIGFVAKPVSPEAIRPILAEYGLHE